MKAAIYTVVSSENGTNISQQYGYLDGRDAEGALATDVQDYFGSLLSSDELDSVARDAYSPSGYVIEGSAGEPTVQYLIRPVRIEPAGCNSRVDDTTFKKRIASAMFLRGYGNESDRIAHIVYELLFVKPDPLLERD